LRIFFEFKDAWKKEVDEMWDRSCPGLYLTLTGFYHYIEDLIMENNLANEDIIQRAFELAEKSMISGDNNIRDRVAICFLENMINAAAWQTIQLQFLCIY
jgi:hypothetical protein